MIDYYFQNSLKTKYPELAGRIESLGTLHEVSGQTKEDLEDTVSSIYFDEVLINSLYDDEKNAYYDSIKNGSRETDALSQIRQIRQDKLTKDQSFTRSIAGSLLESESSDFGYPFKTDKAKRIGDIGTAAGSASLSMNQLGVQGTRVVSDIATTAAAKTLDLVGSPAVAQLARGVGKVGKIGLDKIDEELARQKELFPADELGDKSKAVISTAESLIESNDWLGAVVSKVAGNEVAMNEFINHAESSMTRNEKNAATGTGAFDAAASLFINQVPILAQMATGVGFGELASSYGLKEIKSLLGKELSTKIGKNFAKNIAKYEEKGFVKNLAAKAVKKISEEGGQMIGAAGVGTMMQTAETVRGQMDISRKVLSDPKKIAIFKKSLGIEGRDLRKGDFLQPGVAIAYGLAGGSLEAIMPFGVITKFMPKNLASAFKDEMVGTFLSNISKKIVAGMITEGTTEGAQEIIKNEALRWLDKNKERFSKEELSGIWENMKAGAFMGAFFEGGSQTVVETSKSISRYLDSIPETAIEKRIDMERSIENNNGSLGKDAVNENPAVKDQDVKKESIEAKKTPERKAADQILQELETADTDTLNQAREKLVGTLSPQEDTQIREELVKRNATIEKVKVEGKNVEEVDRKESVTNPISEIKTEPATKTEPIAKPESGAKPEPTKIDDIVASIPDKSQEVENLKKLEKEVQVTEDDKKDDSSGRVDIPDVDFLFGKDSSKKAKGNNTTSAKLRTTISKVLSTLPEKTRDRVRLDVPKSNNIQGLKDFIKKITRDHGNIVPTKIGKVSLVRMRELAEAEGIKLEGKGRAELAMNFMKQRREMANRLYGEDKKSIEISMSEGTKLSDVEAIDEDLFIERTELVGKVLVKRKKDKDTRIERIKNFRNSTVTFLDDKGEDVVFKDAPTKEEAENLGLKPKSLDSYFVLEKNIPADKKEYVLDLISKEVARIQNNDNIPKEEKGGYLHALDSTIKDISLDRVDFTSPAKKSKEDMKKELEASDQADMNMPFKLPKSSTKLATVEDVETELADFKKKNKSAKNTSVVLLDHKLEGENSDAIAFRKGGVVYFVMPNMTKGSISRLMRHEDFTHGLLKQIVGEEQFGKLLRLAAKEELKLTNESIATYYDTYKGDFNKIQEETLAAIAERDGFKAKRLGATRKLINAIKKALNKLGLKFTTTEVQDIMQDAYSQYKSKNLVANDTKSSGVKFAKKRKYGAPINKLGMYSHKDEVLSKIDEKKMKARNLLARLQKGGVTKDELAFSGIKEYLESRKPNEQVDLDVIRKMGVDLLENSFGEKVGYEVQLVGDIKTFDTKEEAENEYYNEVDRISSSKTELEIDEGYSMILYHDEMNVALAEKHGSEWKYGETNRESSWVDPKMGSKEDAAKFLKDYEENVVDNLLDQISYDVGSIKNYKYKGYALEGGKNYSEDLVILDDKRATKEDVAMLTTGKEYKDLSPSETAPVNREVARLNRNRKEYNSPHWDEKNVLGHIRSQEFGDTFLIEEIQSDWHQKGREDGYKTLSDEDMAAKYISEAKRSKMSELSGLFKEVSFNDEPIWSRRSERGHAVTLASVDNVRDENGGENYKATFHSFPEETRVFKSESEAKKYIDDKIVLNINDSIFPSEESVALAIGSYGFETESTIPNAPFKKTWPLMLFKRALRLAVESGRNHIAIIGGKASAERYNLSRSIIEIRYDRGLLIAKDRKGFKVINEHDVKESELPNYIGKEATEKLLSEKMTLKILRGQNLDVGGGGMLEFYDNILPNVAQSYLKKLDPSVSFQKSKIKGEGMVVAPITKDIAESVKDGQVMFSKPRIGGKIPKMESVKIEEAKDSKPVSEVREMFGMVSFDISKDDMKKAQKEAADVAKFVATGEQKGSKKKNSNDSALLDLAGIKGEDFGYDNFLKAVDESKTTRKTKPLLLKGRKVATPSDFANLMMPIRSPYYESLKVAFVDENNIIVDSSVLNIGSVSRTTASSRDVMLAFREARRNNPEKKLSLIVSHNHPSGNPKPSEADFDTQERVESAADLAGLKIKDHIITNGKKFYSMRNDKYGYIDSPKLADWEILEAEGLQQIHSPEQLNKIAEVLRQGSPSAAHFIMGNTKSRIVGIKRMAITDLMDGDGNANEKKIYENVEKSITVGASSILVDLGGGVGSKTEEVLKAIKKATESLELRFFDASDVNVMSYQALGNSTLGEVSEVGDQNTSYDAKFAKPKKEFSDVDTNSKEFKAWFGDSEVVNENGKPLVVYHGTNKDFSSFDKNLIGSKTGKGWIGSGFYFTSDSSVTEAYGATSIPVYLSAKNIFDMKGKNFNTVLKSHGGADGFSSWLKENGYDGAKMWSQFMVLDPTQIKSATSNTGKFSKDNADIRYSKPKIKIDSEIKEPSKLTPESIALFNTKVEILDSFIANKSLNDDAMYYIQSAKDIDSLSDVDEFMERSGDRRTVEDIYEDKLSDKATELEEMDDISRFSTEDLAVMSKGTTNNIREAGYVLKDGRLLDFSGKSEGGEAGTREVDHRQLGIPTSGDISGTDLMVAFMEDTGAVRIDANAGMVNAHSMPTSEQISAIKEVLSNGGFVDLENNGRRASFEVEEFGDKRAVGGIRKFMSGKDIDSGTRFAKPRNNTKPVDTNSKEFKEWFGDSKVVDKSGEPLVVYHGTTSETDFNSFNKDVLGSNTGAKDSLKAFYFSSSNNVADFYRSGADYLSINEKGNEVLKKVDKIFERVVGMSAKDFYKLDSRKKLNKRKEIGSSLIISKNDKDLFEQASSAYLGIYSKKDLTENIRGGYIKDVYINISEPHYVDMKGVPYNENKQSKAISYARENGYDGVIFQNIQEGDGSIADSYAVFNPTQIKSAISNTGEFDANNPDIRYAKSRSEISKSKFSVNVLSGETETFKTQEEAEARRQEDVDWVKEEAFRIKPGFDKRTLKERVADQKYFLEHQTERRGTDRLTITKSIDELYGMDGNFRITGEDGINLQGYVKKISDNVYAFSHIIPENTPGVIPKFTKYKEGSKREIFREVMTRANAERNKMMNRIGNVERIDKPTNKGEFSVTLSDGVEKFQSRDDAENAYKSEIKYLSDNIPLIDVSKGEMSIIGYDGKEIGHAVEQKDSVWSYGKDGGVSLTGSKSDAIDFLHKLSRELYQKTFSKVKVTKLIGSGQEDIRYAKDKHFNDDLNQDEQKRVDAFNAGPSNVKTKRPIADILAELPTSKEQPRNINWGMPPEASKQGLLRGLVRNAKDVYKYSKEVFVRKIQDDLNRLRIVQEDIKKAGGNLPSEIDAYMLEESRTGRIKEKILDVKIKYQDPIIAIVRALKKSGKGALEDVEAYLYAIHAPESNKAIFDRNEKGTGPANESGSGMTDSEADRILKNIESRGLTETMKKISDLVVDMRNSYLDMLVANGLETQEVTDTWKRLYKYYVPLKSLDGSTMTGMAKGGKSFVVKGPESQIRLGRGSKASNIIANAFVDVEDGLIRSERNAIGNAFLQMVRLYPNDNLWRIKTFKGDRKMQVNEQGMLVYDNIDDSKIDDPKKVFTTKVDGSEVRIEISDPIFAQQMNGIGKARLGVVMSMVGRVVRVIAGLSTSYNPFFITSNFERDLITAGINANAQDKMRLRDAFKLVGKNVLNVPKIMLALSEENGKVLSTPVRKILGDARVESFIKEFQNFRRAGGETAFNEISNLDNKIKNIRGLIKEGKTKRAFKEMGRIFEDTNRAVESAARMSIYTMLRQKGVDRIKAASASKNLTVNFNKKGEWGPMMNALYMFSGASIQGNAAMLKVLGKSRTAQAASASMIAMGFSMAYMNRMVGGKDENDEYYYDKLPDYIKNNTLIYYYAPGKYYKLWRLPYGYNIFNVIGDSIYDVTVAGKDTSEAIKRVMGASLDTFNPIGGGEITGSMAVPTIFKPFAEAMLNENWYGGQIMPPEKQFGRELKPHERHFDSVSPVSKYVTDSMYNTTGLSVSPETIDHVVKYASGGLGKNVLDFLSSKYKEAKFKSGTGLKAEVRENVFERMVLGENSGYVDQSKYYEYANELSGAKANYKQSKDNEGLSEANALRDSDEDMSFYLKPIIKNRMKRYAKKIGAINRRISARKKQNNRIRAKQEGLEKHFDLGIKDPIFKNNILIIEKGIKDRIAIMAEANAFIKREKDKVK